MSGFSLRLATKMSDNINAIIFLARFKWLTAYINPALIHTDSQSEVTLMLHFHTQHLIMLC